MENHLLEAFAACLVSVMLWCAAKAMHVVWWRPKQMEALLRQQGIRGTSYKFLHGDTHDINSAVSEALSRPVASHHHRIAPRVFPFFHRAMQKYGRVCMIWIGTKPRVIIGEPEIIRRILEGKNSDLVKPPQSPLVDLLHKGIATLDGERWSKRRTQILPVFHLYNLKEMMPSFLTGCSNLIDHWMRLTSLNDKCCEIDVVPEFHNLAGDVIARAAFGNCFEDGKRIFELQKEQAILAFDAYSSLYIPGFRFVPTRKNRRRHQLDKEIKATLREIIRKKEQEVVEVPTDLLGLLLRERNRMSTEDVIEECKLLHYAGTDTTASLLTWTIVVLSMHPDWQDKARDEVLQICGHKRPDFDTVSRFNVVAMIVNETLRLYPPVCSVHRHAKARTTVGSGVSIPAGSEIFLNMLSLHHDPKFWGDDAAQFNPERFSDGVAGSAIVRRGDRSHRIAFFPFGWGPRTCLGQSFALLETKLALAMILQNFSFQLAPSYVHAPCNVITLQPQHGAPIILHRL